MLIMSEVSLYARANRLCQIEQVPRHLVFVALQAFLKRKRVANDANAALQKNLRWKLDGQHTSRHTRLATAVDQTWHI